MRFGGNGIMPQDMGGVTLIDVVCLYLKTEEKHLIVLPTLQQ
jgi:hypothetical protein